MTTARPVHRKDIDPNSKVRSQHHAYDFDTLFEDVNQRIVNTVGQNPTDCHYFNPAVTVSCSEPTEEFFAVVRKEQARWCRIAGRTFGKRVRRRVKNWSSDGPADDKYTRYLQRAYCFTGVLFIDYTMVHPRDWLSERA